MTCYWSWDTDREVDVRKAARTKSFCSALASALTHLLYNSPAWYCWPLEGPVPGQKARGVFLNTSDHLATGTFGLSTGCYLCSLIWETQRRQTPDVKVFFINTVGEIHSQNPLTLKACNFKIKCYFLIRLLKYSQIRTVLIQLFKSLSVCFNARFAICRMPGRR